jgi:hypothetical protein
MTFKRKHLELAVYWAAIKPRGAIAIWSQLDPYYRFGFVVRLLWLGFVFRICARPEAAAQLLIVADRKRQSRARSKLWSLYFPTTDGYEPDPELFMGEGPH